MPAAKPEPEHEYYESLPDPSAPVALPNPTGPPNAPVSLSESVFQTQADAFEKTMQDRMDAMPKWKKEAFATLLSSGHSTLGPVPSFAAWFAKLQNFLCVQVEWDEFHENLHRLLYHYARWKITSGGTMAIWPSVEYMCRYLGRSENSYQANWRYRVPNDPTTPPPTAAKPIARDASKPTPNSGDLGGYPGGGWWCAPGSTTPVSKLLARWGMRMGSGGDPQGAWGRSSGVLIWANTSTDPEKNFDKYALKQGDIFNMLGSQSPPSGHVGTVVFADPFDGSNGSRVVYISGNGGAKSVNIAEAKRLPLPPGYDYSSIAHAFNTMHDFDDKSQAERKQANEYRQAARQMKKDAQENSDDHDDPDVVQAIQDSNLQREVSESEASDDAAKRDSAQKDLDDTVKKHGGVTNPKDKGTIWIVAVMAMSRMELPPFNSQSDTFKDLDADGLDAYMQKFALETGHWKEDAERQLRLSKKAQPPAAKP